MEKMAEYGDRVQFSLVSAGGEPSYQIMNSFGKAMAFDRNHHLLRPESDEFAGANASNPFTLDQIKSAISGIGASSRPASRAKRVAGSGTTTRISAARLEEQFATQRYEYFRNNRKTLPPTISQHTEEITDLMKKGKSVEEAFGEVVKKYF